MNFLLLIMNEGRFGKPIPGYIPGLGRGAVGFFTRSDIGPARNFGDVQQNQQNPIKKEEENDNVDYSDIKYDKWSGYEGGLFGNSEYDEEDKQADFQYSQIDNYMEERRKTRKEKMLKDYLNKNRNEKPTIKQQFSDLKKELTKLKKEDWEKIPDIQDYTVKKKKIERFTPINDKIIEQGLHDDQLVNALDPIKTNINTGTMTSLNELCQAKNSVLSYVFETMSNKVSGQSSVNPNGYLTDLNSIKINSASDIADFKKARDLLKSVINSNPKSVSGWIAAARLEEFDGKLNEARNIICQAATQILDSEDIWLETARLHPPESAKSILAKGLTHLPNSVKLWIQSANLEHDSKNKSKILKKALEYVPSSEEVWKAAIELENEDVAKILLYKAVECIPNCVQFWLALAKLETYENARNILNKARKAVPSDYTIWINAAKLEEANMGSSTKIDEIIERAIRSISKHGIMILREKWIKEAENCEVSGSIKTCISIIKNVIKSENDINNDEKKKVWIEHANDAKNRGCIETTRQIYSTLTDIFKDCIEIWMEFIDLEKNFGDKNQLETTLKKAVDKCGDDEIFWLMYAKHKWTNESTKSAKEILKEGLKFHPQSESIYLAILKLQRQENNYVEARETLNEALNINSKKIWKNLIQLEREICFFDINLEKRNPLEICNEAISIYPDYAKLYLIAGEMKEEISDEEEAIKIYERGIDRNKKNPDLYIALSRVYKKLDKEANARSILEKALKIIPKNEKIWIEFIKFEISNNKFSNTNLLLSKALKECPESGLILGLSIECEKNNKHQKAADALEKHERNIHIMLAVARLYASENHFEKARKWFENAIRLNPLYGDIWIYFYKMEYENGNSVDDIVERCEKANPNTGDLWKTIINRIENFKLKPNQILKKAIEYFIN